MLRTQYQKQHHKIIQLLNNGVSKAEGDCLSYIDHYGHLTETFLKNIKDLGLKPEEDLIFQELLISVFPLEYGGKFYSNYTNILYLFILKMRCHLLPEIEDILNRDERLADSKEIYELALEHAGLKL